MIKGPGSSSTVDETGTPLVSGKEKTGISSPTLSRGASGLDGMTVSLAVAIEGSFGTGNLVTPNPGEGKARPLTCDGQTVTVTHPAGLDTDPHVALRRLRDLALNQFKRAASLHHL